VGSERLNRVFPKKKARAAKHYSQGHNRTQARNSKKQGKNTDFLPPFAENPPKWPFWKSTRTEESSFYAGQLEGGLV
jgi:hypothetical protein